MKKNSFINGALIATLGIVITKILGIIYVIPFYAIIGESNIALYGYAYTIYNLFLALSTVGIPPAMSKLISEYNTLGYYNTKQRAYKLGKTLLVLLGIIVALITKSGATHAYGIAAKKVIKSRRAAMIATSALGALIFIDDYFNCLTVGAVMSPITDKFKISRAKLAYIIDSTAAPICILAPISSWSAAIAASLPSGSALDGYVLFLQSIPFNIYAILSLVFLFWLMIIDKDFFTMKKYNDELEYKEETIVSEEIREVGNGKVIDIIIPIVALIIICILCMINNGGYFKGGVTLIESFQNCDSMASLVTGALITLLLIANYHSFA